MDDSQLLRYSRHILLDELGIEGQERILRGRALVIGVGGLGSPAALYLATAGIGHLTLVDHDTVDLTNLQRQIVHTQARVGQLKVESARAALLAINPTLHIDDTGGAR
jgi:molybdopterin/thiamine biosynthesis adenylyltransferase